MPYSPPRHNARKVAANKKASQRHYNKHVRTGQEFYNTTAWKKLRTRYAKQNPLCVRCKEQGRVTPVQIVDHIIEIKDGGASLDESNLQSMCRACHNSKTAQRRA